MFPIKKLFNIMSFGKSSSGDIADSTSITDEWFPSSYGFGSTSGERVGNSDCLTLSPVFACINAVSQDVAKVPLFEYETTDDGKNKLRSKLSYLLNTRPNPEMSALSFRQTLTAQAMSWGNGYAEIQKNTDGEVVALWPLPPNAVTPLRDQNGKLIYAVTLKGGSAYLHAHEVLHINSLGSDGISGYNLIKLASQSLGSAKAADKMAGAFFGNNAVAGGYLEHPQNLSDKAQKRLLKAIEDRHMGADKAFRTMVLEEGMKFKENLIPPEQAQLLQTRQFSATEACRWFRTPPHKIADLSKATFSNIEQQSIDYVNDTLTAWFKRWEQELTYKLIPEEQQIAGNYVEHIVEGLLRGDIKTRYESYAKARQWGWLNVNEIRAYENLNKIPGGDEYLVPLNMRDSAESDQTSKVNHSLLIKDIATRLANAEIREIDKHIKHAADDEEQFNAWLDKFYAKHNDYAVKTLSVVLGSVDPATFTLQQQLKEAADKQAFYDLIKTCHSQVLEVKINDRFRQ